ncbi:NUDIX hydrolase [Cupriavidus sp.]|uniref:NUDIX hydrolase n=1 Tax=Burkholderiaceae TaxID=119060 RepID=UPI0031DBC866
MKQHAVVGTADMPFIKPKIRATVICVREGHVLLVSKDGVRWALPGGRPDDQESLVEAAWRELREETAIEAKSLTTAFQFIGATTVHHVFAAAVGKSATPKPRNEIKYLKWAQRDVLDELSTSPTTRAIVSQYFLARAG